MIPKLQFSEMTLRENIDIIRWGYYEDDEVLDVHHYITKYFPELDGFDKNCSREEIYQKIEEVVTKEYHYYYEKIKSEVKRYNEIWKKYNDSYFSLLSKYFDVLWPEIDVIEVGVGLIPVFPRDLDKFSFSISIDVDENKLIEVTAHETLHFMWFEKWKKIHPETPRIEYDDPSIIWQYSEMVTDPILNNKPFSLLFHHRFVERGYDSFYQLKEGDALVMDYLREIYSKNISIDEKINQGFIYVKKNLESIDSEIE